MRLPACPGGAAQHGCWFDGGTAIEAIAGSYPLTLPDDIVQAGIKRRRDFVAGRYCAAEALRSLGSSDYSNIGREPDGSPRWPSGIVGSITHTHGFAWAAVARRERLRSIGVDAQPIMSEERARTLESRISTTQEISQLMNDGRFEHEVALTLLFCIKEAIFKCLHREAESVFDFLDVKMTSVSRSTERLSADLVNRLSPGLPAGTRLEGRFRVAAGCVAGIVFREACTLPSVTR